MITTSLHDLTKGDFITNHDLLFENMLLFSLIVAIILVQVHRNSQIKTVFKMEIFSDLYIK